MHDDDHYYINRLHSLRTKSKLKSHENAYKNQNYCHVKMLEKHNNIFKYDHGDKSLKVPFVILADEESILEKKNTRM